MSEDCCVTQLINGEGFFNVDGLDRFVKTTNFSDCGLSYTVVAVIGPQSSGKSTLMNHLFYTNFLEMDAEEGRSQTTKGIWMAKCAGIEPFTIAMDMEGTDGKERGQDDTTFEKQSSLFALAVADILLLNMWCHDVGREQAANRPLLKTIFEVMMRLLNSHNTTLLSRKTTLLFILRDKTKTPLKKLEPKLRQDIQEIWDTVAKPEEYKDALFNEFFNVEVYALSSYEYQREEFEEQVAQLRRRFYHSISPGGLAGDRREVVPASGFYISVQEIWKIIKENKDLDLPAHKRMVSTVRCEEIANEELKLLASDEGWISLKEAVQAGPVNGFGEKISSILERYLLDYDREAIYYDEEIRNAKRKQLESETLDMVHHAYVTILQHLHSKALEDFKGTLDCFLKEGKEFTASSISDRCLLEFDRGCQDIAIRQAWDDASKEREQLKRHLDDLVDLVKKVGKDKDPGVLPIIRQMALMVIQMAIVAALKRK